MSNPLAIGTTPWSWNALSQADLLCAQAEVAEAMGFDSFWLPENHFVRRRGIPAPLLLLAAAAARTRRITLGTTSYLLPIRHPLLAAEEVAVLDRLCGGRLILGIGRGIGSAMFKAFAVDESDKRQVFQANLDIMRRAWCGEPIAEDDSGQPICLAPLPLQQPSPPLWVAAFGPLALQQVAALGLPYLASPLESLATLAENYQQFHRAVEQAGLSCVTTIPVMRTVFVTGDSTLAEQVCTALAREIPASAKRQAVDVHEWAIVGDRYYTRDKLAEYIERLGLTHLIVRAGISGLSDEAQLHSHAQLLDIVAAL